MEKNFQHYLERAINQNDPISQLYVSYLLQYGAVIESNEKASKQCFFFFLAFFSNQDFVFVKLKG